MATEGGLSPVSLAPSTGAGDANKCVHATALPIKNPTQSRYFVFNYCIRCYTLMKYL